jgi:hypothetical protein
MFFLRDLEEAAAPADRYGLLVGLPAAATALLNEQMHYSCSHGIGKELHFTIHILINPNNLFSELVMSVK